MVQLSTAILKIAFLAITHRPIVRFQQNLKFNLCEEAERHVDKGYMTKTANLKI